MHFHEVDLIEWTLKIRVDNSSFRKNLYILFYIYCIISLLIIFCFNGVVNWFIFFYIIECYLHSGYSQRKGGINCLIANFRLRKLLYTLIYHLLHFCYIQEIKIVTINVFVILFSYFGPSKSHVGNMTYFLDFLTSSIKK